MAKDRQEYVVTVKTTGRAVVFTRAESADEAIDNVNRAEFYGGEQVEWEVDEAESAEVNSD